MTQMGNDRLVNILTSAIVGVRRICYVRPDGSFDLGEGPIEFTFDEDRTIRLESGADGESLRVWVGRWIDPFGEPMTEENRRFVEQSGKWTAFEVSHEDPYRRLVGQKVRDLTLLLRSNKVVGVEVILDAALVRAEVHADELMVTVDLAHHGKDRGD